MPFLTLMSERFQSYHQPVLLSEVITNLVTNPEGIYLDGTLGGGGHAESIIQTLDKNGRYIGLDRDAEAIRFARDRLRRFKNISIDQKNFVDFDSVLTEMNIEFIDGILLDLGLSSYQIDTAERGFSYMENTTLDMRMDQGHAITAGELLNTLEENELSTIFYTYGEERKSRQIARQVVRYRMKEKIERSNQLKYIIDRVIHPRHAIKTYARIFQSLRIAVNQELDSLERTLEKSINTIRPGGRWVIISYHSLEDRIVKNFFKSKANPCTCPEELPTCICNKTPEIKVLTTKVILASEDEIKINPRARSARLRVGEKI